MNEEAIQLLNTIVAKEVGILTSDDIGFLRARSSYLTDEQIQKFRSVLIVKPDYSKIKRSELDEMAIKRGLMPLEYKNRDLLIEAINAIDETI